MGASSTASAEAESESVQLIHRCVVPFPAPAAFRRHSQSLGIASPPFNVLEFQRAGRTVLHRSYNRVNIFQLEIHCQDRIAWQLKCTQRRGAIVLETAGASSDVASSTSAE